jgi:hypothetical protein
MFKNLVFYTTAYNLRKMSETESRPRQFPDSTAEANKNDAAPKQCAKCNIGLFSHVKTRLWIRERDLEVQQREYSTSFFPVRIRTPFVSSYTFGFAIVQNGN